MAPFLLGLEWGEDVAMPGEEEEEEEYVVDFGNDVRVGGWAAFAATTLEQKSSTDI